MTDSKLDFSKGIPGRQPIYAETTEAERRRWRLEATKGLCTEDPKKYISGVHLSVDEMVRLLNDADRAADIAMLSNGTLAHITGSVLHSLVEAVLQHLRNRRPFKFALSEMAEEAADEYNNMREAMRQSVRQELARLWDREDG